MSMSDEGSKLISNVVVRRVNKTNLHRIATMMSSNASENFFGQAVVHSKGKRLNLNATDSWERHSTRLWGTSH
jgi:hypothetical protein